MPSDDMILQLRVSSLTSNRLDLDEQIPLVCTLSGTVQGPIDNLLPVLRALRTRRPLVTIAVVEEPEGSDHDRV